MNKVMTRAQHRPGTRPPSRRDTRRPGGIPPRTPSHGASRTTSPEGRPPNSPGTPETLTRTRPTDNRPPTTAGSIAAPAHSHPRAAVSADSHAVGLAPVPERGGTPPTPVHAAHPTAPAPTWGAPQTPARQATQGAHTPHLVPAQASPRPIAQIPQPRPTDVFADRLLLVLSGQRPVHSMLRHTAGRAYDELAWLAERGPLRARGTRPVVRDIGYFEPRPGAIEAFARIGAGDQLRAMAFRLEQGGDLRWRCTAVELGGPRRPRPADD
ncbi:Rv3235 family protein [Streptomyces sp. DT2A-34]|uniref:Rv3235 family protein n=1 Tax=Streptomyces sp. DT2A-34 TaxID=3051182 RepID=UPI00265BB985|nr:Rv3235 family protein [Streptomyces sp. DT2A-34]MDO0914471.1 Rv3235 family protein [Streptomyces sp. DT2A-34]